MSSIESLFAVPKALPTVPKVVQALIASFERDDVSIDEIAAQLAADPVLSAKTLRLANSAYFHVSRQISTVNDALRMLGFVMVRNLVLGLGMAGAFKQVRGLDLPQFWRYSVHSATAARWLATAAGHNADLAFTVGLMHGLGQLVMHAVLRDEMSALNRQVHPLAAGRAAAEQASLGYHHGDVGAELARRWKFPDAVAAPIGSVSSASADGTLAALVQLAAWRARIDALQLAVAEQTLPPAAGSQLGLHLNWDAQAQTLLLDSDGHTTPMPPLAALAAGLESAFA